MTNLFTYKARSRKGALELSITAIVILIIAITLLTFGITFIKKLFNSAIPTFKSEFERLERQILDSLKNSGRLLDYRITDTTIKRGEEVAFALGIRNSATSEDADNTNEVCFRLQVVCRLPFADEGTCVAGEERMLNVVVGGWEGETGEKPDNWFSRFPKEINIRSNEAKVIPTLFRIRTAPPDRYEMSLRVYKANNNMPCENANEFTLYESESFTINVEG